jgi:hypothetical protein
LVSCSSYSSWAIGAFWFSLEDYITRLGSSIGIMGTLVGLSYAYLRHQQKRQPPPLTTEQFMKRWRERPGYMDDEGRVG